MLTEIVLFIGRSIVSKAFWKLFFAGFVMVIMWAWRSALRNDIFQSAKGF